MAQELQDPSMEESLVPQTPLPEPGANGDNSAERAPSPTAPPPPSKKRPRLDLTAEPRKRGKTMFGILLGTLNKAKDEDKERNKSDAAKRRLSIDQRLQVKRAQEQTVVRRQDEVKKHKALAARKEDDLAIRETVIRLTHKNRPYLSHFLTTSDPIVILPSASASIPSFFSLPFSVAPPVPAETILYYLPAVLLPAQEAYLKQRQESIALQVEQEKETWREDKKRGVEEVTELRKLADEILSKGNNEEDAEMEDLHIAEPATLQAPSEPVAESFTSQKIDEEGDVGEEALEY